MSGQILVKMRQAEKIDSVKGKFFELLVAKVNCLEKKEDHPFVYSVRINDTSMTQQKCKLRHLNWNDEQYMWNMFKRQRIYLTTYIERRKSEESEGKYKHRMEWKKN